MKNPIVFACLLLITAQSFGTEMWVTYPELSTKEKLHRASENPSESFKDVDLISLHEALLTHPVSQSQLRDLLNIEAAAQNEAVNGRFPLAFDKYKNLLGNLELIPNVAGVEKVTFEAKIRMAEMAGVIKDPRASQYWRDAHAWAPDAKLPPDLYSPPVMRQFTISKFSGSLVKVRVSAPAESSVFIDGRRLKVEGDVWVGQFEPGNHQVSVLTPGALWNIKKITLAEKSAAVPVDVKIEPVPAVTGTCESPQFNSDRFKWNAKLLVLFSGGMCERVFDGTRWYTSKAEPVEGRYLPQFESGSGMAMGLSGPEKKTWLESLTKSTWFWVGAGVVAAGTVFLIKDLQSSDTVVIPTNR